MNEREDELFETELRRLKPARLPDPLHARLEDLPPTAPAQNEVRGPSIASFRRAWLWLRWLAPATMIVLAVLVVVSQGDHHRNTSPPAISPPVPSLRADQVEIDRQLLDSFDTVAELPDGEPVRFRCQQWVDEVTLRDSASGVEVVQRTPRINVVPVSFAVY